MKLSECDEVPQGSLSLSVVPPHLTPLGTNQRLQERAQLQSLSPALPTRPIDVLQVARLLLFGAVPRLSRLRCLFSPLAVIARLCWSIVRTGLTSPAHPNLLLEYPICPTYPPVSSPQNILWGAVVTGGVWRPREQGGGRARDDGSESCCSVVSTDSRRLSRAKRLPWTSVNALPKM